MSIDAQDKTQEMPEMATKPVAEHEWLQKLVGDWDCQSEFVMPNGEQMTGTGTQTIKSLGGLWAFGEGKSDMPDGTPMVMYFALGYDLTYKEYRGCWFASVSSHLWKYTGELSADEKVMTLNCVGPNMMKEGESANYRDVIEILSTDQWSLTSYGEDDKGEWHQFMKAVYTRK